MGIHIWFIHRIPPNENKNMPVLNLGMFYILLFYANTLHNTARNIKIMTKMNVKIVIIFSLPLSFVFTKTFIPPPVMAPEAPSDLPPWSKDKTIMIRPTIKNTMSNAFICFLLSCLITLSQ